MRIAFYDCEYNRKQNEYCVREISKAHLLKPSLTSTKFRLVCDDLCFLVEPDDTYPASADDYLDNLLKYGYADLRHMSLVPL